MNLFKPSTWFPYRTPRFQPGDKVYLKVVSLWPATVESVIPGYLSTRYVIALGGGGVEIVYEARLFTRSTK